MDSKKCLDKLFVYGGLEMEDVLNIVTIVAKNYLAQARTLVNSFKKYHPEGQAFVLFADRIDGYFDPSTENFVLIEIDELRSEITNLEAFCFQYSILELSTALKPYVLKYIFKKYNISKLAYFDPDILITENLYTISELLDEYQIILTPHITSPYNDHYKPSEVELLRAGAYNLGFIALANTEETSSMLQWWEAKLNRLCLVDFSRGLFVDQKWIDLVPGLFSGIYILREPGYNVAYWNLHERKISIEGNHIYCNGRPLYFFHFSGYNPDNSCDVSKHQDRHNFSSIGMASNLFTKYGRELNDNGFNETKKWPYAFSEFDNGVAIPDIARRIFLNLEEKYADSFGNPFETSSLKSYYHWLTSIGKTNIPPLLHEIYRMRVDLQRGFPEIEGKDSYNYLLWFLKDGVVQHNLDDRLLDTVRTFLESHEVSGKEQKIRLLTPDYDYSRSWNRFRSYYYNLRDYRIIRPFIEGVKHYIVKNFKSTQRITYNKDSHLNQTENLIINQEKILSDSENAAFGVNLAGYINSEKGMGEAVRSDVRSLQQTNIPFVLNNFIDSGSINNEMMNANFSTRNPYQVNLIHVNADQTSEFIKQKGQSYLNNRYNIGYWAWELSQFPEEWCNSFQYFDEIWVPSGFVQDSVARVSPIPVVRIPHSIAESGNGAPPFDRQHFGIPQDKFVFLFIFDFDSFAARKNPYGIVKAFKKAFKGKDNAILVLKFSHSDHYPEDYQTLMAMSGDENVKIINNVISREELKALLSHIDCYVSLHRSEGFGLTIAEAMSMGKPVIATSYSGNMDFMTQGNSFPVKYNLIEIDQDYGPYKKGWLWAEPDLEHAASLMRYVYDNQKESALVGQVAREHIRKYYSPGAVGKIYKDRLYKINKILENKKLPLPIDCQKKIIEDNNTLKILLPDMNEIKQKIDYIDVNKIPVQSKKPIGGVLLTCYKRAIRKSTFWLLDPLFSYIREISNSLVKFYNKSLEAQITINEKIDNNLVQLQKNVKEANEKIDSCQNNVIKTQLELLVQIDKKDQQIKETEQQIKVMDQQIKVMDQQIKEADLSTKELKLIWGQTQESNGFLEAKLQAMQGGTTSLNKRLNNISADLHPTIFTNKLPFGLQATESFDYFGFEKVFRGSEELIKERQKGYVELFKGSKMVLDIGCGRGEFLELLKEEGIKATGVDINKDMIMICCKKGLSVVQSDFMDYLLNIQDETLDGIFTAQFIEHIKPENIHAFFRCAYLKLRPGGILVAETLNPYNLAQFRFFYVDPTHERPIYPEVAQFLSQTAGFKNIEFKYLPCVGDERDESLLGLWDFSDYAIIAKK
jgi:glycosyltransferase involved in cell wall biosynthesis/SAM-dependent methyltransferase